MKEKDRIVHLPSIYVVSGAPFQNRLAIALRNLPEPRSRRQLHVEVPQTIIQFKGKILLPNGYVYPRDDVDSVMGHESGRQISMFLEMKHGKPRYIPRTITFPRLTALYAYVAIKWPHIAEHIVK